MTYMESIELCRKLRDQYDAELHGLMSAQWSDKLITFSSTPHLQQSFSTGYQRGKNQLAIEAGLNKEAKPWTDPL